MFLKCNRRRKDGKEHRYWSIVESKRCRGGKFVQRHVLYLGEINDSQREAWCRVIEGFDEEKERTRPLALYPSDREVPEHAASYGAQVRLAEMELRRPRQWGACWLATHLYEQLGLDRFWEERLAESREGTCWRHVLETLVIYRLIDPGSEWRLHRQWFAQSAMGDLLGEDFALVNKNNLYRCMDKRPDCVQVVIALVVTPEGFPLAYEVMAGNTSDKTTLKGFLERIEKSYGKAQRIWVMDRGIPTEEVLAQMRASDPPVSYVVGTPKGRLSKLEAALLELPWQDVRPGVEVKLLARGEEFYVLAKSRERVNKERAMRRRQLKGLWKRLHELAAMRLTASNLLLKLGEAKGKYRAAWRLIDVELPEASQKDIAECRFALNRGKLREVMRREGRYLLRTNLTGRDPGELWQFLHAAGGD